jgi:hypothetical protein
MTQTNVAGLRDAFQPIKVLLACYVGLGLVGLGATVLLRGDPHLVNTAVWVRCAIVAVTSSLLYLMAELASRGSRSAFIRLRIASIAVPLAIVVLVALPDPFPVWVKVQQTLCAVVVAGAAVLVIRADPKRG